MTALLRTYPNFGPWNLENRDVRSSSNSGYKGDGQYLELRQTMYSWPF